ncbi:MAG: hypothetical protein KJ587_19485 [Alphaproteobacteria bacterium]|nr:hypothetical protein [Alphaproteobacteria bacterium]
MTDIVPTPGTDGSVALIEKVMTLSQSEFAKSIGAFAGEAAALAARRGDPVALDIGGGRVVITFTKIDGFSFGGLVEMPRARVLIHLNGVEPTEAEAFMRRFDISFQRGGG